MLIIFIYKSTLTVFGCPEELKTISANKNRKSKYGKRSTPMRRPWKRLWKRPSQQQLVILILIVILKLRSYHPIHCQNSTTNGNQTNGQR